MKGSLRWWQNTVVYQVVVPSFLDSDGDGLGDLGGVADRLDYLQWLGVGALWLSPVFRTPFKDLGYDVSDFNDVDGRFGSLETFDALVAGAHARGIAVILDWTPNHTSSEHPWFLASRSSRESPKRDWYIWADAREDGSPPSNWISVFGGSVWAWDEATAQYYMHTFLESQPDLNWRNPQVQRAMLDTLRFWLDRGVDGFRVDALCLMLKDEHFRDNPPNPDFEEGQGPDSRLLPEHTRDQPGMHELVAAMRRVVDEYEPERVLLGELYLGLEQVVAYYGPPERRELHLPLNLSLMWSAFEPASIGPMVEAYERMRPRDGWPTFTLSSHDSARVVERAGPERARLAAMLLLTLPGTPTLYYGEEIGMRGKPIPPESARDPQGRRTGRNRDPERTPMQWSAQAYAGFSSGEPWLPAGDDVATANVEAQRADERSLLNLYRRLIALRREQPTLVSGRHEAVLRSAPLLAYRRADEVSRLFVVLNFGAEACRCDLDEPGDVLVSTYLDRGGTESQSVELRPHEGVVLLSC